MLFVVWDDQTPLEFSCNWLMGYIHLLVLPKQSTTNWVA